MVSPGGSLLGEVFVIIDNHDEYLSERSSTFRDRQRVERRRFRRVARELLQQGADELGNALRN